MHCNLSWAGHKIQSLRPTRTASGADLIPSRLGIWNIYGNFKGSYSFAGLVRAERKMRSREEIGKVTKQQSCAQCTLQSGYKKIRPKEELREARNGRFDRRGKRLLELRKCFITCSQN